MTAPRNADEAAGRALTMLYQALDLGQCFRMEAGAGAGKTYSLVKALHHLIQRSGRELLRSGQKVACITFTNVATEEIRARVDGHPAVHSSTIHSFLWENLRDFQDALRQRVSALPGWREDLGENGKDIGKRRVQYELGHRKLEDEQLLLNHNDVIDLGVEFLQVPKFRQLMAARFPVILIDEYQDTNRKFAAALCSQFLDRGTRPLIGFFGDHWQKIYGDGCGELNHSALKVIEKGANFRSDRIIVESLNRIRTALPQVCRDPTSVGSVAVYHTNNIAGARLRGQHWEGDLPRNRAHDCLELLRNRLKSKGWTFSPGETRILMLTHKVLASEQDYRDLADVFDYSEQYAKMEDPYIEYFVRKLEYACDAYSHDRFGEMFTRLGPARPAIGSHAEKLEWSNAMDALVRLRSTGTVGDVIDHLAASGKPELPDSIREREMLLTSPDSSLDAGQLRIVEAVRRLRSIPYAQVAALAEFIEEKSPFSTKHGVKGAEFDNVLAVFGRGWSHYDFNRMLEIAQSGASSQDADFFERNRNLFYVVCSRPKHRLALLFTQKLSPSALATLKTWFGEEAVEPV